MANSIVLRTSTLTCLEPPDQAIAPVIGIGDNVTMNKPRVLIFGAAKPGIGQATARLFHEEGFAVVGVAGLEEDEGGREFRAQLPITWELIDTFNAVDARARIAEIPSISHVVHADFYFYMENATQLDLTEWQRSLTANLTIPKIIGHCAETVWNETCRSVVFITSSEANTGSFGAQAYSASKAAVHNLVKSLANTSGGKRRYNALAAGWIGGVMDTDEVFERSRAVTPLGRLGAPDEIAKAARWLVGDDASFVNGATLFADGGYTGVDTISKFEYEGEFGPIADRNA